MKTYQRIQGTRSPIHHISATPSRKCHLVSCLLLRQVFVGVRGVRVPLQVLAVDERFNPAFDHLGVGAEESELGQDLRHQLLVEQRLAGLHDAHNRRLNGHGAVFFDPLGVVGVVEVCHRNPHLVHFAAEFGRRLEGVRGFDGAGLGVFLQHFVLAAAQRVQHPLQSFFG